MSNANNDNDEDYCRDYLPPSVLEKLQAGAFRSLVAHLQQRSDEVSNMALMTTSGFCRNCLAKWMVLEARRLVDRYDPRKEGEDAGVVDLPIQALNALGYEEAAQHVYGMNYEDWKQRHQKKATSEELERYQASEPLQAKHDKNLLAKRTSEKPKHATEHDDAREATTNLTVSNVCCQNVEEVAAAETAKVPAKYTRGVPPFTLPPIPSKFKDTTTSSANKPLVSIAVLTVSDRAANNEYEHGDLSGPAVCQSVRELTGWEVSTVAIVPDDSAAIQAKIKTWSSTNTENNNQNNGPIDLILTTGGTGFSPRDITPEATKEVVDHELPNLMTFCITECSHIQPLSSLSRGTAGILNSTLIANLPGNPKSIGEILPLLLPLLLHAVADLQESSETPEVAEIG